MSCDACRAALAANDDVVGSINAVSDDCGCEAHSMSDLSPGIVTDDEFLHFFVRDPDGLTDNNFLSPVFVQPLFKNGLSVLRHGAEDSEFRQTITELKANWVPKNKKVHGMLTFQVEAIRTKDGARLCCVYDTALVGKPHHADLMSPTLNPSEEVPLRKLKERIVKAVIDRIGNDFTAAVDIRDGAFKDLLAA